VIRITHFLIRREIKIILSHGVPRSGKTLRPSILLFAVGIQPCLKRFAEPTGTLDQHQRDKKVTPKNKISLQPRHQEKRDEKKGI
jgi:hypothetical protein